MVPNNWEVNTKLKRRSSASTKKSILIVHVSNLNYEKGWFPKLVTFLEVEGFSQYLFLKNTSRYVSQKYSENRDGNPVLVETGRAIAFLKLFLFLTNLALRKSRGQQILLLAQGHKEAVLCYLINKIFRLHYGIIHHIQPEFFDLYQQKFHLRGSIHNLLYRLYVRNAKYIQSLSEKVDKKLYESGVGVENIFRCPPGIDISEIMAQLEKVDACTDVSDERFNIIMVGRLSWEKNFSLAIEVFKQIIHRDKRYRLYIFGEGPLRSQLNKEIQELMIEDFVYLKGFSSDVLSHVRASDCLFHASLTESYGQVLVEAALMGVPVICTDVGVAREIESIENAKFYVLPELNEDSLWNALESICKSNTNKRYPDLNLKGLERHDITNVFKFMSRTFSELDLA